MDRPLSELVFRQREQLRHKPLEPRRGKRPGVCSGKLGTEIKLALRVDLIRVDLLLQFLQRGDEAQAPVDRVDDRLVVRGDLPANLVQRPAHELPPAATAPTSATPLKIA